MRKPQTSPWAMLACAWLLAAPARAELPIGEPMIEVAFDFAGAPLEAVADRITPIIENHLGAAAGLSFMISWSRAGQNRFVLKFKAGVGESAALASVRRQIAQAQSQLPPATSAPVVGVIAPERRPVAYLAFTADRLSLGEVTRAVEPQVREILQEAVGVAAIRVSGARPEIGLIHLDPARLAAYGVSVDEIRAALIQGRIRLVPDQPDRNRLDFALSDRTDLAVVGDIVVKVVNGVPVRLRDIAQIERGLRGDGIVVRYDGAIGVLLEISRRPEIGASEAARALNARLPGALMRLPAGLSHKTGFSCEACVAAPRR